MDTLRSTGLFEHISLFCCTGKSTRVAINTLGPVPNHIRKLLTRNTYYKPAEEDISNTDTAHSKADILNLISSDVREVEDLPYALTNFARLFLQLAIGCTYIWAILGKSLLFLLVMSKVNSELM